MKKEGVQRLRWEQLDNNYKNLERNLMHLSSIPGPQDQIVGCHCDAIVNTVKNLQIKE